MPEYPDPLVTANAQAGMNRDSVISSALINNYDQHTPWGSVTYNQQGTRGFTDSQGNWVEVPYFNQNVNLSPDQAVTWGNMSNAYQNLSGMAANMSGLLSDYLAMPFDPRYGYSIDTSTATPSSTAWNKYTGGALDNAFDQWYRSNYANTATAPASNAPTFENWSKFMDDGYTKSNSSLFTVDPYADPMRGNYSAQDLGDAWASPDVPENYKQVYDQLKYVGGGTDKESFRKAYDLYLQDYGLGGGGKTSGTTYSMGRDDARALFDSMYANAQEGDSRFGAYTTTPGSAGSVNRYELSGPNALNDWQSYNVGDYSADRQKVEDAIMSRYNTRFAQDEAAMDAKLRAQGLLPGSEAYNQQFDAMTRQKNDAAMQAILAGGQEQSRLNDLAMGEASFNNQLRQSKLAEMLTLRNQPINEMTALLSGTQINAPQFNAPFQAGVQAPDYMNLVDRKYQADSQAAQAGAQGLFSILGMVPSLFGMSDRRTKRDVRRVGSHKGLGVYRFRYIGSDADSYGFMADEVDPRAVTHIGGVAHVNYVEAMRHAG